ncbi:MAG: methyltransferase [Gemmataceae bacterium]|nr:methyltransferase [Gemmataceae bacterium]
MLTRCRIVLVRTHYPGNLGATARVMRNFGLTDLVLVDPVTSVNELEARRMATHGLPVLDAARVVPDLGTAVADCVFTLATSGLAAGVVRQTFVGTPEEKLPELVKAAASGPVAVVFGPEPHGLSNAEITRCHGLVHIPVDPTAPALNLAQAVAICCYELYRLAPAGGGPSPPEAAYELAPFADQERMFDHLRQALEAVGYLYGTKADPLMHAVRHLLGRAMPTPQEVKLLHGLARQLLWMSRQLSREPDAGHGDQGK